MKARHFPSLLLTFTAFSGAPAPAVAACEAASADVSWVRGAGAETCPTAASIRSEVARRLGRPIGAPGEGKSIEVAVERTGDGWSARIVARGCGGEPAVRELTSAAPTCEAIASAAVLVIALAVDPQAALAPAPAAADTEAEIPPTAEAPAPPPAPARPENPAPARPPSPAPPDRPAPAAAQVKPSADAAAPDPGVETRLTFRGVAAEGLLPTFAPGVAWSGEWRFSRWISALTGVLFLPEQPATNPTFAFGMTAGWAGACSDVLQLAGRVFAGPCVRVLAGTIHAVVRTHPTIIGSGPGQRAWAGAAAGGRALIRVAGPLVVEAGVEAVAPITRYSFVLRDAPEPIFFQPPVALLLHIGAGLTFP